VEALPEGDGHGDFGGREGGHGSVTFGKEDPVDLELAHDLAPDPELQAAGKAARGQGAVPIVEPKIDGAVGAVKSNAEDREGVLVQPELGAAPLTRARTDHQGDVVVEDGEGLARRIDGESLDEIGDPALAKEVGQEPEHGLGREERWVTLGPSLAGPGRLSPVGGLDVEAAGPTEDPALTDNDGSGIAWDVPDEAHLEALNGGQMLVTLAQSDIGR